MIIPGITANHNDNQNSTLTSQMNKKMIILGLNAYHGDSSACIIDGKLIAAAEKEKILIGSLYLNESLTLADKDIQENWARYREHFLRRLKT